MDGTITKKSWVTDLDTPFGYLKNYIEKLEKGKRIERQFEELNKKREEIVAEYRKLIKIEEDRKVFDEAYELCRRMYTYVEDHLFWVDWFRTIWFMKVRDFGKLFTKYGFINEVDDIFLLTGSKYR